MLKTLAIKTTILSKGYNWSVADPAGVEKKTPDPTHLKNPGSNLKQYFLLISIYNSNSSDSGCLDWIRIIKKEI